MKREILVGVCCALMAGCGTTTTPVGGGVGTDAVSLMPTKLGAQSTATPCPATPMPTTVPTDVPTVVPTEVPTEAPTEAPVNTVTVTVRDFEFSPSQITVAPGTTVVWQFEGPSAHTSTSDTGSAMTWDSGLKQPGESFSLTFDQEGSFSYHCTPHPQMQGVVTVTAAGGDDTTTQPGDGTTTPGDDTTTQPGDDTTTPDDGTATQPDDGTMPDDGTTTMPDDGMEQPTDGEVAQPTVPYIPHFCARDYGWAYGPRGCP